jgi:hypothetical protein
MAKPTRLAAHMSPRRSARSPRSGERAPRLSPEWPEPQGGQRLGRDAASSVLLTLGHTGPKGNTSGIGICERAPRKDESRGASVR